MTSESTDTEWLPYGRQTITEADVQAVEAALLSGWLTTGPAVDRFEAALSEAVGGVSVAVLNSGTAALHAAYAEAGLGPGNELVTTPLTFAATATAALHLGAKVRFADVSEDTLTLAPEAVSEAAGPKTAVVSAVDFAGQPADLDSLAKEAHAVGAVLVEDAAHSIGARYKGRPVGSVADITTFSFHPVKTVTTGEGGAVAATDPGLVEAVRRFRNHGLVRDRAHMRHPNEGDWYQEVQALGLNYRLPDLLAALGTSQLARLREYVKERERLVALYKSMMAGIDGLVTLPTAPWASPAWHLFVVRVRDGRRHEVFEHLRARGIGTQVHYAPVYWHPLFEDLGYRRGLCPVAEAAYHELLSLPLYPGLTDSDVDRVVSELRSILT